MINADLSSRSFGFICTFALLISLGLYTDDDFIVTPMQGYDPLVLKISPIAKASDTKGVQFNDKNIDANEANIDNTTADNKAAKTALLNEQDEKAKNTLNIDKTKASKKNIDNSKQVVVNKNIAKKANAPKQGNLPQGPILNNGTQEVDPSKSFINKNNLDAHTSYLISDAILDKIKKNVDYPKNAIRRKITGIVRVKFKVEDGIIKSFELTQSSGHKILDNAAKKLANKLIGFNCNIYGSVNITVPIEYSLL